MNEHDCVKIDLIKAMEKEVEHLKHRVNGYEDEAGIFADVKTIIKNQEDNKSWVKGSVFTFTGFIIMLFYFGITDHNKIQEFPDTYLGKASLNQVIMELKQQTAIMTKIVNSPNLDSLTIYRKELNFIQQSSSFDRMMRATRGGTISGKKEEMTDQEFKEKLKEVDEKLFKD